MYMSNSENPKFSFKDYQVEGDDIFFLICGNFK